METPLEFFLRMNRNSRREPMEFDANAAVRIDARLLSLATAQSSFPFLP